MLLIWKLRNIQNILKTASPSKNKEKHLPTQKLLVLKNDNHMGGISINTSVLNCNNPILAKHVWIMSSPNRRIFYPITLIQRTLCSFICFYSKLLVYLVKDLQTKLPQHKSLPIIEIKTNENLSQIRPQECPNKFTITFHIRVLGLNMFGNPPGFCAFT